MLFYNFKNYEGFKELFGMTTHGNGVVSRKNKILLALYKSRTWLRVHINSGGLYYNDNGRWKEDFLRCKSLGALRNAIWGSLSETDGVSSGDIYMLGDRMVACPFNNIRPDSQGWPEDETVGFVRYRNAEGRAFKIKAGRFMRHLLDTSSYTQDLPEQVKVWFCEAFAEEWKAQGSEKFEKGLTLFVDDNFKDIYDGCCCKGNFGSCMEDNDQWSFYRDAVDAQAAYLKNKDDEIVARCIIFTNVRDEDGNKYRLAERQYSTDSDLVLQRHLINRLIAADKIDGYKQVGASCHDAQNFVSNNGEDWSDKYFHIVCRLENGDTMSYQDSFKWYDLDAHIAYNFDPDDNCFDLADTSETFLTGVYSDIYDEWIDEDDAIYIESRETYVRCDDAVYCKGRCEYEYVEDCVKLANGEWCHEDDVCHCDHCGDYYEDDEGYYSELTGGTYCCEDCLEIAEIEYAVDNCYVRDDWGEWVL